MINRISHVPAAPGHVIVYEEPWGAKEHHVCGWWIPGFVKLMQLDDSGAVLSAPSLRFRVFQRVRAGPFSARTYTLSQAATVISPLIFGPAPPELSLELMVTGDDGFQSRLTF